MSDERINQRKAMVLRRRSVSKLVREGRSVEEIARSLNVPEHVVRRDIRALRAASARHDPWGNRAACAAAFIEDAEAALQKVRAAQADCDNANTHMNLVKLEWGMLIKFIELTAGPKALGQNQEKTENDEFTNCSNEELIRRGKELGVDVTPFERALEADAGLDDAGDYEEAA